MNLKETNPKDAVGTGKAPFSTVPSEVVAELGLVMLEGARKYGRHNYRAAGVRASVYFDAAMRHLTRFWEGEDLDPDSGMPHLIHAMACCAVLRDSQVIGNWSDDRPPALPDGWMVELNEKAKAIVEKYPNPLPAHTELDSAAPAAYDLVYTDYVEEVRVTVDSLDDAGQDYVWENQYSRFRWSTGKSQWEFSSLKNRLVGGWLQYRHSASGPFTRAQKVDETY